MFPFSERHFRKNQRKAFIHTLTAYGFGPLGGIGGPPLDRFGNLSDVPDGFADGAGVFDLTVAPMPEPSAVAIISLVGLFFPASAFKGASNVIDTAGHGQK